MSEVNTLLKQLCGAGREFTASSGKLPGLKRGDEDSGMPDMFEMAGRDEVGGELEIEGEGERVETSWARKAIFGAGVTVAAVGAGYYLWSKRIRK